MLSPLHRSLLLCGAIVFHTPYSFAGESVSFGGTTASGIDYGLTALIQYDVNRFSGDTTRTIRGFEDQEDWRRAGLGIYVRKKKAFELALDYDFKADVWLDAYVRIETRAGSLRVGQFRTPVGLDDGATSSGGTVFLERAAPQSMVYEGRRMGLDWTRSYSDKLLLNAAVFRGGDLQGNNEGDTVAARAVYAAINDDDRILHIGGSASREWKKLRVTRLRAPPEAALVTAFLLNSRVIADVDGIDRRGVELIWRHNYWSIQSEWLSINTRQSSTTRNAEGRGGYIQTSLMLTGETKPYRRGALHNPTPHASSGAWELAARYSCAELNSSDTLFQDQHNVTIGVNLYLGKHLKLMSNYVHSHVRGETIGTSIDIMEMRAQLLF